MSKFIVKHHGEQVTEVTADGMNVSDGHLILFLGSPKTGVAISGAFAPHQWDSVQEAPQTIISGKELLA